MQNLLSLVGIVDANFSLHLLPKIAQDLAQTAAKQFGHDAETDASAAPYAQLRKP